ncbi:TolC family protein [Desulfonatronovibrio magnus]|uniref:TolC family protein n=1 Tax=Desulfonatronovibrio magnus TaxID=698827 RepID=UPI0005EB663C|nr:TolC family protein [Desulfonatronovibrio magnus]
MIGIFFRKIKTSTLILIVCLNFPAHAQDIYDLERIVNRAIEANWGMIDARDDIHRSNLRLESAESDFELKIYPGAGIGVSGGDDSSTDTDLNLEISLERKTQVGTRVDITPSVQRIDNEYRSRANLRIIQPLLRGAGRDYTMSGVYSARYGTRSALRAQQQREIETVLGAVRNGYEVVRQRELLRLRQESYQRLSDLAEATAIKERMGLVNSMDLFRVRIQLNQAEDELIRSQESYIDALDALKIFLALPLERDISVTLPLEVDRIYPDEQEMIDTAMDNRIEIEQVRDALAESRRLSDVARKDTLPELDVILSFSQAGDSSSRFPGSMPDSTSWGISLGSSTDLRRTSQKAAYEESLISLQQAARRQSFTRDDITAQVKRELRNLERLDKAIDNQEEQIHQSRGQLELSRIKFQHGMADNFDLIDAEISLRRSQTQLASAVIDYIVGQYRLRAAIGTLVQR